MNLRLAKKNRELSEKSFEDVYENLTVRKIRVKYSLNQELAILRKKDTKPLEFAEYNDFVEQCKSEAKKELEI